MKDSHKKRYGCNNRSGNGEDNPEKYRDVIGAVDPGRLFQVRRDSLKIGPHQYHIPYIYQVWNDVDPKGVHQPHGAQQEIKGDQTAAEVHRNDAQDGIELSSFQVAMGHAKRKQGSQEQSAQGSDYRSGYGHQICRIDFVIGKHQFIVSCGRHSREKCDSSSHCIIRIVQGYGQGIDKRIKCDQEDQDHKNDDKNIK